jgi:hypothetical protein
MDNLPQIVDNCEIIDAEPEENKYELIEKEADNIDTEFEYARNNIVLVIEQAKVVAENSAQLALDTDSPRAVEVYSGLIKNLVDINKDLLTMRETRNNLLGKKAESKGTTNIKNAVFVGSTQELYEMMKGNKK